MHPTLATGCEHTELIRRLEARIVELEELVRLDSLTRLYNHKAMVEQLEHQCQHAQRSGAPLTVAMLDLDYFKAVNDTYGHLTGDAVLIGLARFLKRNLRTMDIIGRMGGEEFSIIFPNTTVESAAIALDRLRQQFATRSHRGVKVTFSAGLAQYQGGDYASLLEEADKALYQAKRQGRNQVAQL